MPYLAYMSRVQPDVAPQLAMLSKFAKYLLPVFAELGSKGATASSLDPNSYNQGVNANLDPLKVLIYTNNSHLNRRRHYLYRKCYLKSRSK